MSEHQQTQKSTESKSTSQKQATPRIQAPSSHPMAIIQRAKINPKSLTPADILQLQRTIGNRAVGRLFSEIRSSSTAQKAPVQRQEIPEEEETCPSCIQKQEIPEEEEPLQGKMIETVQRQEIPEEEEPLQGKFKSKPEISCPSCFAAPIMQRQELEEEEKTLQGKMIGTVQRQEIPEEEKPLQTKRENNTGMPDNLKAGVESLSGIDMNDVRVHYNSSKPAEVGALAYTQGTNIHVAPGQEKHLPHEAWHVVQQAKGRVKPTMQIKKGVNISDDVGLEDEATRMGNKAEQVHAQMKALKENKRNDVSISVDQEENVKQGSIFVDNRPEAILQKNDQPLDYNLSTGQLIQKNESKNKISGIEYLNSISAGEQEIKGDRSSSCSRRTTTSSSSEKMIIQRKTVQELESKVKPMVGNIILDSFDYSVLTVGAKHTGEMYHLKAAKSIFPKLNTLIWGVKTIDHDETVNKAFDIGNYMNEINKTFYTTAGQPKYPEPTADDLKRVDPINQSIPWHKWVKDGLATSLIMYGIKNSHNGQEVVKERIKEGIAPHGDDQQQAKYARELHIHGFRHDQSYVLVNFRESGHTTGTAPQLDTGISGYQQIINSVRTELPGVNVVPMGEYNPPGDFSANLINYWNWNCCAGGRRAQAGLLRYLNDNYHVRGAVGMRSGLMDSLAFSGIKILSIDIDPSRRVKSPSKYDDIAHGWERGNKLESALGIDYGRTFLSEAREGETLSPAEKTELKNKLQRHEPIPHWLGSFKVVDVNRISASVRSYFGPDQPHPQRDLSHPLIPTNLNALILHYRYILTKRKLKPAEIDHLISIRNQLSPTYNDVPNKQNYIHDINLLLAT